MESTVTAAVSVPKVPAVAAAEATWMSPRSGSEKAIWPVTVSVVSVSVPPVTTPAANTGPSFVPVTTIVTGCVTRPPWPSSTPIS